MKILTASIIIALLLGGCDISADLQNVTEKQPKAQELIKDRYGWDSQIGWKVYNGVLTQVSVTLNAKQVGGETVSAVESATKDVVSATFDSPPKVVVIQLLSEVSP